MLLPTSAIHPRLPKISPVSRRHCINIALAESLNVMSDIARVLKAVLLHPGAGEVRRFPKIAARPFEASCITRRLTRGVRRIILPEYICTQSVEVPSPLAPTVLALVALPCRTPTCHYIGHSNLL